MPLFGGKSSNETPPPPPQKKGEVNELSQQLQKLDPLSPEAIRRDTLRKVITVTTQGFDTSKLFQRVIMLVHTKDVIQKKMIYQYVTHYAHDNQELALLTINTLSNDCRDDSPLIRGLALRHLASLRVAKIQEHLVPLIKEGLNDPSPYVRKTAVMSIVKLNRLSPKTTKQQNFVDRLYSMIRDKDPQVVVNCINALNELLVESGGIKTPKKMVYFLLNRINEYNAWQLGTILECLLKYQPKDNKEVFNIMNLLDDKLQLSNTHVVMSITNIFLQFTENLPKTHNRVYMRLKEPLLLILATETPEMQYSIMKHIKIMIDRCPVVFQQNYADFYPKYEDPTYIKEIKFNLIAKCADKSNIKGIMDELSYWVSLNNTENDQYSSRMAIEALGEVAIKVTEATEVSLSHLLDFLDLGHAHVISETYVVLCDILRKYNNPEFNSIYLPQITKHWKLINEPRSLVAFIWLLGEFGEPEYIKQAPYILEIFIDSFTEHHHTVRLEILSSAMKLFFKRPPEMQKMLGRLYFAAISDASHADVHDRALFYYRLMKQDVLMAQAVVGGRKKIIVDFAEEESAEYKDRLFAEFNTLSILYGKPASAFIVERGGILGSSEEYGAEESDDEEEEIPEESPQQRQQPPSQPTGPPQQQQSQQSSLLDFNSNSSAPQQSNPQQGKINLNPQTLYPQDFEMKWVASGAGSKMSWEMPQQPPLQETESKLRQAGLVVIATNGGDPNTFYCYGQKHGVSGYFLVEERIYANGTVNCLVKHETKDRDTIQAFKQNLYDANQ